MTAPPTSQMPFLQHLEELRRRLLRALVGIGVAFAISLAVARPVYGFIVRPVMRYLPEGSSSSSPT